MADFLRLDDDLLASAARTSPPLVATTDDPDDLRVDRRRREAADRAEAEARRARARAAAREGRLDELTGGEDAAWLRVEALIAARKPAEYDTAVALLADLKGLAEREDRHDTFTMRVVEPRQKHARKPTLIERLDRARIWGRQSAIFDHT